MENVEHCGETDSQSVDSRNRWNRMKHVTTHTTRWNEPDAALEADEELSYADPLRPNRKQSRPKAHRVTREEKLRKVLTDLGYENWKLPPEYKERARAVIERCLDAFAYDDDDIGLTHATKHEINTGDAKPIKQAPRRLAIHDRLTVKLEIARLLRLGII